MKFTPTDEQAAIVKASFDPDHLLVVARAGAAKTSTLVLVAEAHPAKSILSLAFNTAIRDEMKERMPANVTSQTLNGCGYQAWQRYLGKRCRVEARKTYELLRQFAETLDKGDATELWDKFSETMRAVDDAKTSGVLPNGEPSAFRPLCSLADFFLGYKIELDPVQQDAITWVTKKSWEQTRAGILDFNDMLLAPAVSGVSFDFFDIVLVDEAQDLSAINHVLIKKLVKKGTKLIAVGDPCQAIYGFRGADEESMNKLGTIFSAKTLYLTTTFRCASAIVESVRWRAPDIRAASWAKEGEIRRPITWTIASIPDGAAVICRNNAPLFSLAIQFLRAGRYPELAGRDVVKGLVKTMKKFGKPRMPQAEALVALTEWAEKEKQRQKTEGLVEDMRLCMEVFINETTNLGDAMAFAEKLAEANGRIKLMTGHKAKGLEFDHVFFLNASLCRRDRGQDANIEYVIVTRAKNLLTYINLDDLEDE